ncbi:MAG: lptD [Acidobacteria bacterium]|nr:lptD [Acidobacteriota bacterium]
MLNSIRTVFLLTCLCFAAPAAAQLIPPPGQPSTPPAPAPAPGPSAPKAVTETTVSERREGSNNQKDWHFIGHVEMDRPGSDTKIYADDVMAYTGENKAIATGNVVLAQGDNRISAERAEFNTETGLGTFYNATGFSTVKPPKVQPGRAAVAAPQMAGQETIVMFFGEKIEKIGPKKYRITNGGFSTCMQPTPRWDLHAGTVLLNVDHYTVLTNAVMRVKGVPMFYTPILYYPTKREDRATGILMPTYGSSSLRGQSIHNGFFWAINRSQDATITHDWYSKTGQGVGTEYRYNAGTGDGSVSAHLDDQHATVYTDANGVQTPVGASRSYEVRGAASQLLPFNLRSRATVNYFSSIVASQAFNTNIYDASRNNRSFGGNVVGAWGKYSLNVTMDHSEYFSDANNSYLAGSLPRVSLMRNERPIANSPVYFSVSGEYVKTLRATNSTTPASDTQPSVTTVDDTGLSRLDVLPQIRYPFKKWQWFTVNSTISWRDTYYTRSYQATDLNVAAPKVADVGLNRTLYTIQSQIVGPVFNKVWDTPDSGYAEKFKHSIEPVLTINRTSSVDNIDRIVKLDGVDQLVGGTTLTYGLNNRFYAKRKLTPGVQAQSREIFDVELSQSYYTNQLAAQYDLQYQTNQGQGQQTNFSPIALSVRAVPTDAINTTLRAEFDARYHKLRTISANTSYSWTTRVQVTGGWTKRGYIPELAGFNDPTLLDHAIFASSTMHTKDNRFGGIYSVNLDLLHRAVVQQRISAFYNAQCCGLALEYQTYNYGVNSVSPIPADHRFFLSFTLAGLGNFSPFNGALSGVPR